MVRVAISLGSNLGDRRAHLTWAIQQLRAFLTHVETSDAIETEPVDVPESQPPYLNMAAVGETTLTAEALIAALLDVEKRRGRERRTPKAPRTLDLDLIFYGDTIMTTPATVLPHPRYRARRFVLEPLAAIAPEWLDPVTGRTVQHALDDLNAKEKGA